MNQKLSSRAVAALEILRAGGKFRKQLETVYGGREQFKMRLIDSRGARVSGVGFKTFYELQDAGLLLSRRAHDARSSAWPEEWVAAQNIGQQALADASMMNAINQE